MTKYTRKIGINKNLNLIDGYLIPPYIYPSILFLLDRVLGKVELTSQMKSLLIDTFNDEELTDLCSAPDLKEITERKSLHDKIEDVSDTVLIKFFYTTHGGKEVEDKVYERSLQLCNEAGIDENEAGILYLLYLGERLRPFYIMLHEQPLQNLHSLISFIMGIPLSLVTKILSPEGRLKKTGLVEPDFFPPPHYTLADQVIRFLTSEDEPFCISENLLPIGSSSFNLSDFPFPEGDLKMIGDILNAPGSGHILFHGEPGTGKTELARCYIHQGNLKGFMFRFDEGGNFAAQQASLTRAAKNALNSNAILLIDEADSFINTETPFGSGIDKGWLVNFMDNHEGKIIWISNSTGAIHPATARRFSYNLEFRKFNHAQRIRIWENSLNGNPLGRVLKRENIESLSREFETGAGGISYAVSTVSRLNGMDCDPETALRQVLSRHELLVNGGRKNGFLKSISREYNPAFINCDGDAAGLPRLLENYFSTPRDLPVNLLFWGDPGTGKTEFAKYLSEETGRPLLVRRASDLMGKLVGETEQNIAEVFREAADEGAILLLDEADTFFLNRVSARNAWEKTQTNELLTQMENFSGVLICCTNHLELLDKAVLRRFTRKIRFLPPKDVALTDLYRSFFPNSPLDSFQEDRLKKMEGLTPGDFFTVKSSLVLFADTNPEADEILAALEDERKIRRMNEPGVAGF